MISNSLIPLTISGSARVKNQSNAQTKVRGLKQKQKQLERGNTVPLTFLSTTFLLLLHLLHLRTLARFADLRLIRSESSLISSSLVRRKFRERRESILAEAAGGEEGAKVGRKQTKF